MQGLASFEASDLKLIYVVLHRQLMDEMELLDSDFFTELQAWLQDHARHEGVDVSDHGQWDAWLKDRRAHSSNSTASRGGLRIV